MYIKFARFVGFVFKAVAKSYYFKRIRPMSLCKCNVQIIQIFIFELNINNLDIRCQSCLYVTVFRAIVNFIAVVEQCARCPPRTAPIWSSDRNSA